MFSAFEKVLKEHGEIRWTSQSFILDVTNAIRMIGTACDTWNIRFSPGNDYIQFNGFNITFTEKNYGCDLSVYIWKDTKAVWTFLALWAYMQNKGTAIKGGGYKKEFEDLYQKLEMKKIDKGEVKEEKQKQETSTIKKPWELMPEENEDMVKMVRLWCTTDMSGAEIAKEIPIGETTFSNYLSDLRERHPHAGIPKGAKERSKYLREWEKYNQH